MAGAHHRIFCAQSTLLSPEYDRFWKRLAAGESFSDKFLRLTKSGQPVWLEAHYVPVLEGLSLVQEAGGVIVQTQENSAKVVSAIDDVSQHLSAK